MGKERFQLSSFRDLQQVELSCIYFSLNKIMEEGSSSYVAYYLLFGAALGITSSTGSFYFIIKKLKINDVIKKLLLFASIQQFLGYGIFFGSILSHVYRTKNKLTCFLACTSIGSTTKGTQAVISMISIIRFVSLMNVLSSIIK